jgi:hypothetical protein
VSSIWTPDGEYTPEEPERPRARGPEGGPPGGAGPPNAAQPDAAQLDEAQVREALARLASTPVAAILADHAVRLHELAVLHLGLTSERPDSLGEAALAIDGMAALVEGLGDRLGDAAQPLSEALAQLRVGFVQVRDASAGS